MLFIFTYHDLFLPHFECNLDMSAVIAIMTKCPTLQTD